MGVFLTEMINNLAVIKRAGDKAEKYMRANYVFMSVGAIVIGFGISLLGFLAMAILGITCLVMSGVSYLLLPLEENQSVKKNAIKRPLSPKS